jgi:hypothetical protein
MQVGAIRTHSIEEMVDILVALLRVKPPGGFNTCAVGNGGGASVMATDELERAGLRLPPIPGEIREGLKDFIDLANSMLRNPIDISPLATVVGFEYLMDLGSRRFEELLREKLAKGPSMHWARLNAQLRDWPGLDLVIYHHGFDVSPMPLSELMVNCIVGPMALAAKACDLPNAIVLHSMGNDHTWQSSAELRGLCVEFGLPLFLSMRGAATAMRALIDYNLAHPGKLAALHSS